MPLFDGDGLPFDPPPQPAPRRRRRSTRRKVVSAVGILSALLVLAAGGLAVYVHSWFGGLSRVTISHVATTAPDAPAVGGFEPAPVDPSGAVNVLITGSDGRACIDPKSPYAGAFLGNGVATGARSDTVLVLRLDPAAKTMAILSFPQDLWVTVPGGGHDRINATFRADNPSPLVQTIEANFGVRIDHYVGVDFCAFRDVVNAVGGLSVPFQSPARDSHTGLDVTQPGCHAMNGDEALAYVRSRYYEHQVNGKWVNDGTSDLGRIARQQDFIRRLATKAISAGVTNPLTAKRLLDSTTKSNVRIDAGLGLIDLVRYAKLVKDLGPQHATSYRLDGKDTVIRGGSVIVADLTSAPSRAMLAVFRGQRDTGVAPPSSSGTGPGLLPTTTTRRAGSTKTTTAPATATPTAVANPADAASNMTGVYPPADVSCP